MIACAGASLPRFHSIFRYCVKHNVGVQDRISVLFAKLGVVEMIKLRLARKYKRLDGMQAALTQCVLYGVSDHMELIMLRQAGVMEALLSVFQWDTDTLLRKFHDDNVDSLADVDSGSCFVLTVLSHSSASLHACFLRILYR